MQNLSFPLCFIDEIAFRAKRQCLANPRKCLKRIVFYIGCYRSVFSKTARFEKRKCVYPCILQVQMRFLCDGKISRKSCDARFPLYFTGTIAIAENRKVEISHRKANVSKPSPLPMKVTCRMSTRRSPEAKTAKLAETFTRN